MRRKIVTAALVAVIACLMTMLLSGCSNDSVAASINGHDIMESQVTERISEMRSLNGLDSDEAWAQWLVNNDMSVSDARTQQIDYIMQGIVLDELAEEHGVTVSGDEIASLVRNGEDQQAARRQALYGKLADKLSEGQNEEEKNEQLVEAVNSFAPFLDGARFLTVAEFDDCDKAQSAFQRVEDGEDIHNVSSSMGGSLDASGWDSLSTFDDEILEAVESHRDEGFVTGPVALGDGNYCVVQVTHSVSVPEGGYTSAQDIPAVVSQQAREMTRGYDKVDELIEQYLESADIWMSDMPGGLPYDVSLEGYSKTASQNGLAQDDVDVSDTEPQVEQGQEITDPDEIQRMYEQDMEAYRQAEARRNGDSK